MALMVPPHHFSIGRAPELTIFMEGNLIDREIGSRL